MVNYEVAGLEETLLGFGTIMMQTYMGELLIHHVSHPAKIQKKLLNILRDNVGVPKNHLTKEFEDAEEQSEA
jgi:hypothetical protein